MEVIKVIIVAVLTILLITVLSAVPVMLLWNWIVPELFGLKSIGFTQALGLSMLCSILFKSSTTTKKED